MGISSSVKRISLEFEENLFGVEENLFGVDENLFGVNENLFACDQKLITRGGQPASAAGLRGYVTSGLIGIM